MHPNFSTPVLQSKGLAGSGTKEAVKGNLRRTRNRKSRRPKVGSGAGGEQERRVVSRRILGSTPPCVNHHRRRKSAVAVRGLNVLGATEGVAFVQGNL